VLDLTILFAPKGDVRGGQGRSFHELTLEECPGVQSV